MLAHRPYLPNILFIMADQLRADTVGWRNPYISTPNLDDLANHSIVCSNTYVQSPQCQPSRASILTGKYPTAHQVWWNHCSLATRHITLPQYLPDHRHAWFGKLDLMRRGQFHKCWTFEDWRVSGNSAVNVEFDEIMATPTWTGKYGTPRSLHHEECITDAAIEHIRGVTEPWFVAVSYYGPHPPYASPEPFCWQYDPGSVPVPSAILEGRSYWNDRGYAPTVDEWRETIAQYYGQVSWIDDCIGRLLAEVGRDTVVIFMSDHGDILGDHGLFSKGMYAYEGNTRIPLLLRIPGHQPLVYDELVQAIDVLPTILELSGQMCPVGVQGRSILGAVRGEYRNEFALSMIGRNERLRMIRWDRYKYWICGEREVLFDVVADPGETNDLCWNADLLSGMRYRLLRGLISAEDPMPAPTRA